ncbi:hypothetical protein [Peptoanaerobacter stomatis]|uniref:hypothetical protein n=1 Tax=Peptoanaerobacter stomatis TaxID=796937 RepID=UPI003FA05754
MISKETMMNKKYRGEVMRVLALFYPTPITVKQIKLSLLEYGITNGADVSKHLQYLFDKNYIMLDKEFAEDFREEHLLRMSPTGVDLIEGSIDDDAIYL